MTDPAGDRQGCNAADNAAVTVTLSVPSGVTPSTTSLSFTTCNAVQNVNFAIPASTTPGDYDVSVSSVTGGKSGSLFNKAPAAFTLHVTAPTPSDTTPPSITPTVTGTAGTNGWYTSNVTVSWMVVDNESAVTSSSGCDAVTLTTETTGQTVNVHAARTTPGGTTNAASVTIKLDKTGTVRRAGGHGRHRRVPTAGTPRDVTVATDGTDTISGPVTLHGRPVPDHRDGGQAFNGSCTNDAGLTTNAAPLTVKLDKTAPSAALAVTAGTAGANGWYTTDVTVATTGTDIDQRPGRPAPPTSTRPARRTGTAFNGSCTNDAGLSTNADAADRQARQDRARRPPWPSPPARWAPTAGTPRDVTVAHHRL